MEVALQCEAHAGRWKRGNYPEERYLTAIDEK